MGLFKKKIGLFKKDKSVGIMADIIRCDESNYLIWKWHPDGKKAGEHKREYSIRFGSHLVVKDGEVAVFVYKQNRNKMQDFIVGPCDKSLKTVNLPLLSGILGAGYGGDTPFQAEVYFINLSHIIQTKFAVPYFDVFDSRYPDFSVPIAVRGTITFQIENYEEFVKAHRLGEFTIEDFQSQIKDAASRYIRGVLGAAPALYNIPAVQLDSRAALLNDAIEKEIKTRLRETFAVSVSGVDIAAIDVDKYSDGYRELSKITKELTAKNVYVRNDINNENYAETLRIQREEGQYAAHMQTRSANLGAYQVEKQAEVGVAGAEALGQMGANNAGGVDLGNGTGFNPAAMMASMAVGGAVGQNIAGTMNGIMNNGQQGAPVPPPIPTSTYHVAVDGQPTGPFDISVIKQMAASGQITSETLVWKQRMASWARADSVDELKGIFPPPLA
jgi:membrane protease subunit (stomatin/prohibitin family)